jgi:hypothetical protein
MMPILASALLRENRPWWWYRFKEPKKRDVMVVAEQNPGLRARRHDRAPPPERSIRRLLPYPQLLPFLLFHLPVF